MKFNICVSMVITALFFLLGFINEQHVALALFYLALSLLWLANIAVFLFAYELRRKEP